MEKISFNLQEKSPKLEITVQVRDKNGNPTGKTKSFSSEEGRGLSSFYEKQKFRKPRKRRNKKVRKKKGKGTKLKRKGDSKRNNNNSHNTSNNNGNRNTNRNSDGNSGSNSCQ